MDVWVGRCLNHAFVIWRCTLHLGIFCGQWIWASRALLGTSKWSPYLPKISVHRGPCHMGRRREKPVAKVKVLYFYIFSWMDSFKANSTRSTRIEQCIFIRTGKKVRKLWYFYKSYQGGPNGHVMIGHMRIRGVRVGRACLHICFGVKMRPPPQIIWVEESSEVF